MLLQKRWHGQFTQASLFSALAAGCVLAPAQISSAADFTWTGAASTAWGFSGNWLQSGVDSNGIPDNDDNVFFNFDTTVRRVGGTASEAAQNLTIADGVTVTLDSGGIRVEEGIINNAGSIVIPYLTYLDLKGVVNLKGGGSVVLQDSTGTWIRDTGNNAYRLVNNDNIIRGEGRVQIRVVNNHIIRAENGTLEFYSVDNQNGRFEVASNGKLKVSKETFDIERLVGGTIHFDTGGTFEGAGYYQDVTITGDALIDKRVIFEDTLTNQGVITLANNASNNGEIILLGDSRIEGGGTIVLGKNGQRGTIHNTTDNLIVNVDNVIRGFGSIDGPFVNQSLIRVEGGSMYVGWSGTVDNAAGRVEVASDAVLNGNILGGTVHGESGATLDSVVLKNLTLTGAFTGTFYGPHFSGTIDNQASISTAEDISLAGLTTLTGGGTILFDNATQSRGGFSAGTSSEFTADQASLVNADNTLHFIRYGFIDTDFENHGTILLESAGIFSRGDLTLHDTSLLQAFQTSLSVPTMVVTGDVLVDGDLELTIFEALGTGDERQILRAASVTGAFDSLSFTGLAEGLGVELVYSDTDVRYRVVEVPEPSSAILLAGGALLLRRRRSTAV